MAPELINDCTLRHPATHDTFGDCQNGQRDLGGEHPLCAGYLTSILRDLPAHQAAEEKAEPDRESGSGQPERRARNAAARSRIRSRRPSEGVRRDQGERSPRGRCCRFPNCSTGRTPSERRWQGKSGQGQCPYSSETCRSSSFIRSSSMKGAAGIGRASRRGLVAAGGHPAAATAKCRAEPARRAGQAPAPIWAAPAPYSHGAAELKCREMSKVLQFKGFRASLSERLAEE